MDKVSKRLRERARELQLSDAEVARRAGLSERRYGHYVQGTREPDFATFLRICAVMDLTPNDVLLPITGKVSRSVSNRWLSRLIAAARRLDQTGVELAALQIEVLADHRSVSGKNKDGA